jgi:peptidoglycan/xylan/chitin deacetylase (PgdA/CDA1 family)
VDGESALYYRVPDRCRHQLSELHQRMYGPTIAIWKILDLLALHNVPGTFYVPGYIVDLYPNVIHAIRERGYPLGLHGYQHETMDDLDEAREAAVLARAPR